MELTSDSILIATDEKADSYKFYDNSDKLDKNLKVVAISDIPDYKDVEFVSDQSIAPGMMYGKHPYLANTYVDLNIFEDNIFNYTQRKLREIAVHLGAKKISFSVNVIESKQSKKNIHIEGRAKGVKPNIDLKQENESKLKNSYTKEFTFTGGTDAFSYQRAQKIAQDAGLMKEGDVEELFEYHNPEHPNQELSRKVRIRISQEFNSRLEIAATVDYLKVFNVKGKYEDIFKIYNEYIYEAYFEW